MKTAIAAAAAEGNHHFCHFGPEANLLEELEDLFRSYGESGTGRFRRYLHDEEEAAPSRAAAGYVHRLGGHPREHRPAVSTRACTEPWSPTR